MNDKQIRFCEAYLSGGCANATKAAIDAGYPEKNAKVTAFRMLKKQDIRNYINERKNEFKQLTNTTVQDMVNVLLDITEKGRELDPSGKYQNLNAAKAAAIDVLQYIAEENEKASANSADSQITGIQINVVTKNDT